MTPIEPGAPLPDVTLEGPDGAVRLHDAAGRGPLVIAFYTEDATPTCTAQLCAFRDDFDLIVEAGASLLAISADDRTSHARFSAAQVFPFPLLSTRSSSPRGLSAWPTNPASAAGGPSSWRRRTARFASRCRITTRPTPNQFQAVFEAIGLDLS